MRMHGLRISWRCQRPQCLRGQSRHRRRRPSQEARMLGCWVCRQDAGTLSAAHRRHWRDLPGHRRGHVCLDSRVPSPRLPSCSCASHPSPRLSEIELDGVRRCASGACSAAARSRWRSLPRAEASRLPTCGSRQRRHPRAVPPGSEQSGGGGGACALHCDSLEPRPVRAAFRARAQASRPSAPPRTSASPLPIVAAAWPRRQRAPSPSPPRSPRQLWTRSGGSATYGWFSSFTRTRTR